MVVWSGVAVVRGFASVVIFVGDVVVTAAVDVEVVVDAIVVRQPSPSCSEQRTTNSDMTLMNIYM